MRHGTWQETGGGSSLPVGVIVGGAVIAAVVYGLFLAVAELIADLITAAIISGLVLAFTVPPLWLLLRLYRRRHGPLPSLPRLVPQIQHHELPGPERPAIGQQGPLELHQHTHYHWHGTEQPAEIVRRQQAE
jgi:hypothetical protein